MSSQSLFFKAFTIGLVAVWGPLIFGLSPVASQDTGPVTRAVSLDSLPPLEQARLFLIARQFKAALLAAEDAAVEKGLGPAAGRHAKYADAAYDTASVHLYRGLALELQRMFPEARADYDAFLSIEPGSWRTEELLKRYSYVTGQALRSRARSLRDEGIIPESGTAQYGVGGFPLYNNSSIPVMSQVAFGLTGVLNNSLGLLDHFSDQDLKLLPYSDLRLLLDEILPEEVYGQAASIDIASLTKILEVQFLTSGVLQEVSGSLTSEISVGTFSDLSTMNIEDLQASYTPIGLLDLQRTLILAIADSIQLRTGLNYVPSRNAFVDSVEAYLIDDVGRLLDYGFALEQLLLGEPVEAQALMMNLTDLAAKRDLEQIDDIFARSTPPIDNLLRLTALSAPTVPLPGTGDPDTVVTDTVESTLGADPEAGVVPITVSASISETRTAHILSAASTRNLAGFGIWGPTNSTFTFDHLQRVDPRSGVAGTLDPTRASVGEPGVAVKVVIPIPGAPRAISTKSR